MISFACHCSGCQKLSASAYSLTLALPAGAISVTRGEPVQGALRLEEIRHMFCDSCKTWMYTEPVGMPFVNLRPTMLEDSSWVVPFVETCTSEKLGWVETPAVHSYEQFPDEADYPKLMADFAERGCKP